MNRFCQEIWTQVEQVLEKVSSVQWLSRVRLFVDTQKVPNLIEEEIKSLNSFTTIIEITSIIWNLPTKEVSSLDSITEFYVVVV